VLFGIGYVFLALLEDMLLFVELTKVEDGWLCHNGMIGTKPKLELDCFGRLAVGKVKDNMENIAGGGEPIASCG
jgi:hypothetical protein